MPVQKESEAETEWRWALRKRVLLFAERAVEQSGCQPCNVMARASRVMNEISAEIQETVDMFIAQRVLDEVDGKSKTPGMEGCSMTNQERPADAEWRCLTCGAYFCNTDAVRRHWALSSEWHGHSVFVNLATGVPYHQTIEGLHARPHWNVGEEDIPCNTTSHQSGNASAPSR